MPEETKTKKYKVNVATLAYPTPEGKEKRVKSGSIVDDVPAISLKWLLAQGIVEEI